MWDFKDLFKHGVNIVFASFNFNRFINGATKVELVGPSILSPATGHWPFRVFHFVGVTGKRAAWQMSVMGVTFGSHRVSDLNDDGTIAGPDYRKHYIFFSALNHKYQLLEDIINANNTAN